MSASPFDGVGTALVTPFRTDGSVDHAKLADFIEFQIGGGVQFLVPCGTTGESATMSVEEQAQVIKTTLGVSNGRLPVLAGCGGNDTAELIERGKLFREIGATHVLSVSPYYNKPSQEGIYRHFKAFHQETGLEVMLYNIQGRTGSNVLPETMARMAEEGIIFAVKEASGSLVQIQKVCQLTGDKLQVFSGDDAMTLALIAAGGVGVVCTCSNVLPRPISQWVETIKAGDFSTARDQLKPLLPVFETMFIEPNPGPIKAGAALLGLMEPNYRLPMVPPTESTMHKVREVLQPFGVV